jgi:hypothetical protein
LKNKPVIIQATATELTEEDTSEIEKIWGTKGWEALYKVLRNRQIFNAENAINSLNMDDPEAAKACAAKIDEIEDLKMELDAMFEPVEDKTEEKSDPVTLDSLR